MLKVKKQTLLLLACSVWSIAGINIMRLGIIAYTDYLTWENYTLSALIFILFYFLIFSKLVQKHTKRIGELTGEKQFFLKFFDVKSFSIMAIMMTLGIVLRANSAVPQRFIAFFYTGLGTALLLAGIIFGFNYTQIVCIRGSKRNNG